MTEGLRPPHMEAEVKRPEPKPMSLIMLSHHNNVAGDIAQLQPWGARIRQLLESNHTGKVAVFVEDETGTPEYAGIVTDLVSHGVHPAEAKLQAQLQVSPASLHENPDLEEIITETRRELTTGFEGAANNILGEITAEFPGRVLMVSESQPEEIANELARTPESQIARVYNGLLHAGDKMSDDLKFAVFRSQTKKYAKGQADRETTISTTLQEVLSREDVIGGVGFIGAAHTGISHALTRAENESGGKLAVVERIFPEKEGETYYFHPLIALLRKQILQPEVELTDAEIRDAFTIEGHVGNQYAMNDMLGGHTSRQQILAQKYRDYRELEESELTRIFLEEFQSEVLDDSKQPEKGQNYDLLEREGWPTASAEQRAEVMAVLTTKVESIRQERQALDAPEPVLGESTQASITEQENGHNGPDNDPPQRFKSR